MGAPPRREREKRGCHYDRDHVPEVAQQYRGGCWRRRRAVHGLLGQLQGWRPDQNTALPPPVPRGLHRPLVEKELLLSQLQSPLWSSMTAAVCMPADFCGAVSFQPSSVCALLPWALKV